MRFSSIVCAGIVAACAVGPASAQTSVDRTFKASSQDCRDVQWSADILRDYPGIAGACQSVEQRDGRTFVKFQGTDDSSARSVEIPVVREQSAAREPVQLAQSEDRHAVPAGELPATAGGLPLVGWSAVLMILIGTGVTVYRMLQGSPPARPKRRVSGKALRAR